MSRIRISIGMSEVAMSNTSALAVLPYDRCVQSRDDDVSHLVSRALANLGNDCERARRYLNDALALLRPHVEEPSAHELPANGRFRAGGLARWQATRTVTYIDCHLESGLDVKVLAELVSFSKSHFSRAFRRSFGISPMAYVKLRRIERAKGLMTSTNQQLTEIALTCGFADQSHFNRSFRRAIGESPGRWRRINVRTESKTSDTSGKADTIRANGSASLRNKGTLRREVPQPAPERMLVV
jgi:AraC family transcriptional regulator